MEVEEVTHTSMNSIGSHPSHWPGWSSSLRDDHNGGAKLRGEDLAMDQDAGMMQHVAEFIGFIGDGLS